MKTLIVGASGATGRLLVEQLLNRGDLVKIILRPGSDLSKTVSNHKNLSIIHASILELSDAEMSRHVKGCDAVACCLGHKLTLKGIFGQPRRLVTDATRRLCNTIKANKPPKPVKFVLMNTVGNSNRDILEPIAFSQKCVIFLVRLLLPPHVDNEKAADFLRVVVGHSDSEIEWVAVRPDALINEKVVTKYAVYASPNRNVIFNPGTTSRINVAHFMAELITNQGEWTKWKKKMPAIYNME